MWDPAHFRPEPGRRGRLRSRGTFGSERDMSSMSDSDVMRDPIRCMTSHVSTLMPASTRFAAIRNVMNRRSDGSPRKTTRL